MYKVHVFYPNSPGVHFDLDYYAGKHMSMVRGLLGPNCTGVSVQAGLAGGAPGQPATYIAIGALDIASLDEFGAAMAKHGAEIMADIPNYTDAKPIIQISEEKA